MGGRLIFIHNIALLVVCLVATFTGNMLGGSMYHMEIHSQKLPFLPHEPAQELKSRTVDTLLSSPVLTVPPNVSFAEVKHILDNCKHSGFPVVNEKNEVLGLLLRGQLSRKFKNMLKDGHQRDQALIGKPPCVLPVCIHFELVN